MQHYSPSQLVLFNQCKRKYQFQYIIYPDRKRKSTPQLERGSNVHSWIDKYLQNAPGSRETFPSVFDGDRRSRLVKFLDTILSEKEAGRVEFSSEKKLGFTKEWMPCAYEESYFRGIIDLIMHKENNAYVIDWKTGKNYNADILQMECYIYMVSLLFPRSNVSGYYFYIDKSRDEGSFVQILSSLNEARENVLSCLSDIQSEQEFLGHPDFYCSYCDFIDECPEKKAGEELSNIGTNALSFLFKKEENR